MAVLLSCSTAIAVIRPIPRAVSEKTSGTSLLPTDFFNQEIVRCWKMQREGQALRKFWPKLSQEQSVRFFSRGIRFFLAAALTASQTPGGYAPFALGCVAASGAGGEGLIALLGTLTGAVLFLNFSAGLAHLAAAVLICTAAVTFRGLKIAKKVWFFPVCTALILLAVRGIYVMQSASPVRELLPCLTAVLLAGISTRGYTELLRPEQARPSPNALAFLAATLLCALSGAMLGNMDVSRVLLSVLVLVTAWQRGVAVGAGTGLCVGLLADLCAGTGTLFFAAAWGVAGLAAGTRTGRSRPVAALTYLAAVGVLLLPLKDVLAKPLLEETLLAGLVFFLIPPGVFGGKRLQKPEIATAPAGGGLKDHLSRAAAAFHDLYDSLGRGAVRQQQENPAVIFDRAAEKACRDCALCELCWKKEYVSTFNAMNDATPYLLERGRAMAKDFPQHFTDRCIHFPELLTAINGELSTYLLRAQYRRQMEETRRSARGQYEQMGELLSAAAAGLGEARPVNALAGRPYRIGAALRPKQGESVCGDSVTSFETGGGLLCLLLSDGNGSGEEARRESAMTNRLLRQFLEAGITAEAALKTLNSALTLRCEETGGFSTIDLLTVDLHGGETAVYKYGAAPTYLKKGGNVRRITCGALPAGLRDQSLPPETTHFSMEEGAFLLMISDGVADMDQDEWLQNLLAGWEGNDPQMLAGLVLQEAEKRGGRMDDCAAQVLYFPENPTKKRRV